jgi:RNA polymerase sigma-70 factor (ECF subfamily)
MTNDVSSPAAESDPVTAALNDPGVQSRLLHAARAFLLGRPDGTPAIQRMAEAEEIVQTARVRAWERRAQFNPELGDVVNWLVGFVRTVARENVKKHSRAGPKRQQQPPALEDLAVDLAPPVPDVVSDKLFVAELLAQLSPAERELLRLRYEEGLTCAEIGERIGGKENAVRVRVFRLIGRLKRSCGQTGEVAP